MDKSKRIKFLLHPNCYKLAKWLRFLGYDSKIIKSISFLKQLKIAKKENRVFITIQAPTKTKKIFNWFGVTNKWNIVKTFQGQKSLIYLKEQKDSYQLKEMKYLLTFHENYLFTRCPLCNFTLSQIDKNKVRFFIPRYIFDNHSHFRVCRGCGKIYWKGTHYKSIKKRLKELFKK